MDAQMRTRGLPTPYRELPVGARQQGNAAPYPLGAVYRSRRVVGYTGRARYSAYECRELSRNKSGTAEVRTPLSLNKEAKAFLFAL